MPGGGGGGGGVDSSHSSLYSIRNNYKIEPKTVSMLY